jgi:hypothetical protein
VRLQAVTHPVTETPLRCAVLDPEPRRGRDGRNRDLGLGDDVEVILIRPAAVFTSDRGRPWRSGRSAQSDLSTARKTRSCWMRLVCLTRRWRDSDSNHRSRGKETAVRGAPYPRAAVPARSGPSSFSAAAFAGAATGSPALSAIVSVGGGFGTRRRPRKSITLTSRPAACALICPPTSRAHGFEGLRPMLK